MPTRSLQSQLFLIGLIGLGIASLTAAATLIVVFPRDPHTILPAAAALLGGGGVGLGFWAIIANIILRPLDRIRAEEQRATHALAARTQTVNHLLEFSQTIQGAGRAEQVYQTLTHSLRTALNLWGLAILTNEPDAPAGSTVQIKNALPNSLLAKEKDVADMDAALCPCLRQNLPRQFRAGETPVRCAIDRILNLPDTHPQYCIPFALGRKMQVVVHMLLPEGAEWSDELQQLAHAYVNTACAALMSLQLLDEAQQRSMTDPLTQLFNRRSLDQLLQREVALAERHDHALSLVMLDLDQFKQINDTHGHAAGDYLLKSLADCIRMTLRRTDLAFRVGGDEFVIALPQTNATQARQVVEKLRQAFAAAEVSSAIANLEKPPTLSIGLAQRCDEVLSLEQLLAAADAALYDAKHANRNCVRVYQSHRAA